VAALVNGAPRILKATPGPLLMTDMAVPAFASDERLLFPHMPEI